MFRPRILTAALLVVVAIVAWTRWALPPSVPERTVSASGERPVTLAERLRSLPGVSDVRVAVAVAAPEWTIIHVKNWHLVSKPLFIADLRDSDPSIADQAIDDAYARHLVAVEDVQREQVQVLRRMAEALGIRSIYLEGLAEPDRVVFDAKVRLIREMEKALPGLRAELRQLANIEENAELRATIESAIQEHRLDLLRVGAPGKLLVSGEINEVLPLEDSAAHQRARPVDSEGRFNLDALAIEEREDAQVRILLEGGPVSIVVLGGAHDLADNVRRLGGGDTELIEIETTSYRATAR